MSTTTTTADKRTATNALDHLDYDEKTARRAAWEAYEFTITAPGTIQVSNASYGDEKHTHTYEVTVEDVDGVGVPARCECPGYEHHYGPKEHACKHMLAIATKGGQTLLNAALSVSPCLAGLPACSGPDNDELPCYTCYSAREKAEGR